MTERRTKPQTITVPAAELEEFDRFTRIIDRFAARLRGYTLEELLTVREAASGVHRRLIQAEIRRR